MKYLNDIKKNIYDTQTEITNEEIKRNDIQDAYILANKINTFIDRLRNISTSFEPANGFIKDTTSNDPEERKISYVYKQWNEEIFIKDGVEDYIDIILPMIHLQILYKFPSTTDLSYYNCMEDLQEVFFYEVKDETTIKLHVSFCIKKPYGAEELNIPDVKLRINIKSSKKINN